MHCQNINLIKGGCKSKYKDYMRHYNLPFTPQEDEDTLTAHREEAFQILKLMLKQWG